MLILNAMPASALTVTEYGYYDFDYTMILARPTPTPCTPRRKRFLLPCFTQIHHISSYTHSVSNPRCVSMRSGIARAYSRSERSTRTRGVVDKNFTRHLRLRLRLRLRGRHRGTAKSPDAFPNRGRSGYGSARGRRSSRSQAGTSPSCGAGTE